MVLKRVEVWSSNLRRSGNVWASEDLERDGLVVRKVYPVIPPRVEYSLTPLGHTLEAPLNALEIWAQQHMHEIQEAQVVYDSVARS
jgi:DNA-binding HxlR family transcriptional regulator